MMSRHNGVNCDACLLGNFRGKRYKCLICYDYDLCAACYGNDAVSDGHSVEHPMQCILTQSDINLYYEGETVPTNHKAMSFTCPYCGKVGFSDAALEDHVGFEHADATFEVICPICASTAGGDANLMTDDLAKHLVLEHRGGPRDLISFLDTSLSGNNAAAVAAPATGSTSRRGYVLNQGVINGNNTAERTQDQRIRRANFSFGFSNSRFASSYMNSPRPGHDPLLDLVAHISTIRRTTSYTNSGASRTRPQQPHHQQPHHHHHHHQPTEQRPTAFKVLPGTAATPKVTKPENKAPDKKAPQVSTVKPKPKIKEISLLLSCIKEKEKSKHGVEKEEGNKRKFIQDVTLSTLL